MDNSIWDKLSKIDVSAKVEKKGRLNFLSWAWAWGTLMEHYPSATYAFGSNEYHVDDTVTVHCSLTINDLTHAMWLPVMDNRNNSVQNPTSRNISDTKMRCLVKCIAMFGLGHYIYAGEDILQDESSRPAKQAEDDDKPWYNDFDKHRDGLAARVAEGKETPDQIIKNIRESFKLNKKVEAEIRALDVLF